MDAKPFREIFLKILCEKMSGKITNSKAFRNMKKKYINWNAKYRNL